MNEMLMQWLANPTIRRFLTAAALFVIVIAIARIIRGSITRYVKGTDTRYRLRKFITFLSYLVIVLAVTVIFSDQLGGLTVALGVAGAGVAFALQEVIASFAGWFAITFAHFYATGDRVEVGGIKGDVIDISFLRTTLMEVGEWVNGDLYTGRVVRVANSFVFKAPVYNYSGDFPFLWDELTIPVKYGSDHRLARELILSAAEETVAAYAQEVQSAWDDMVRKYLLENARLDPSVTMAANDNWIEFTLRYVVDLKERRGTKDILFSRILDKIESTDGKVQIASATFHLVEAPEIGVRLSRTKEEEPGE